MFTESISRWKNRSSWSRNHGKHFCLLVLWKLTWINDSSKHNLIKLPLIKLIWLLIIGQNDRHQSGKSEHTLSLRFGVTTIELHHWVIRTISVRHTYSPKFAPTRNSDMNKICHFIHILSNLCKKHTCVSRKIACASPNYALHLQIR
jgi:hypothetical protein